MTAKATWNLNNTPTELVAHFRTAMGMQRKAYVEPKHTIDDEEYMQFVMRVISGAEARAMSNPAILPQVVAAASRLNEVRAVAVAFNALRFRQDPMLGASMAECAAALGVSVPTTSGHAASGIQTMMDRVEASGLVLLGFERVQRSEAAREKAILREAASSTVVALADFRARRAA